MSPKVCPICKSCFIWDWESACERCWSKLTGKQQKWMVTLNLVREECRKCGFDPFNGVPF